MISAAPISPAQWSYRKLRKKVALALIGVEVTEKLDWEWPRRPERRSVICIPGRGYVPVQPGVGIPVTAKQLKAIRREGIFTENAWIPGQYLPA